MKYFYFLLILIFINCNHKINELKNVKFDVNKFDKATFSFINNNCEISSINYLKNDSLPILKLDGKQILSFNEHLSEYIKFRKLFFNQIVLNPTDIQFESSFFITEYYTNNEICFSIETDINNKHLFYWNSINEKYEIKEDKSEYDYILNFEKGSCICLIDGYFNNLIISSKINVSNEKVEYETIYSSIVTN